MSWDVVLHWFYQLDTKSNLKIYEAPFGLEVLLHFLKLWCLQMTTKYWSVLKYM